MSAALAKPAAVLASDPGVSAWVGANAGSGKTYVLTARVIRLLLDGTPPSKLLCLTYTRAAAAEMRARVFQRLSRWAVMADDALRDEMVEMEGEVPSPERMTQARRLFATALETPGGLKIQTIHAFCERLIGRFPAEAGAPVPFSVLTEAEAQALKHRARVDTLDQLDQAEVRDAMRLLAPYLDAQQFSAMLDGAAGTLIEEATGDPWRVLSLPTGLMPDDVVAEAGLDEPGRLQLFRAAAAVFLQGKKSDTDIGKALSDALLISAPSDRFLKTAQSFFGKTTGERLKNIGTGSLRGLHREFFADFDPEIDRVCKLLTRYNAAQAAAMVDAITTLGRAIRARYQLYKRARGALDFDDLIKTALYLLRDSDAAAWALFKLDGGLDHILIDEAQDTSPRQWRVVEQLAAEFFAGAGAREAQAAGKPIRRTLFAVGDDKQSIFSFQGADPREFDRFRGIFRDRVKAADFEFVEEPLTTSRRSAPEILALVDAVFAEPELQAAASSRTWQGHVAHRERARGLVELWPLTQTTASEEPEYWLAPLDQQQEGHATVRLADKLATTIKSWIGHEQIEEDGALRPMRAGDVLILVQMRGRLSHAIIRKLKQAGVPVAGADRLKLLDHIAVKDLIAYGRAALLPEDDLTIAALLRSPFFGISEEQLFELAHGRNGTLRQALHKKAENGGIWKEADDQLSAVMNRLGRDAPFDFYARILSGGGRAKVLKRLGIEAEDVIDEFLAQAAAYEENEAPSLEGFLHWLEATAADVKRDPDEAGGAVRVLTVHGAKGLEAPVVILPDTMTIPRSVMAPLILPVGDSLVWRAAKTPEAEDAMAVWRAAQEAEHRRLLYVALTRPRDRLIVCGWQPLNMSKASNWYEAIKAGFALLPGVEHVATEDGEILRIGNPPRGKAASVETAKAAAMPGWVREDAPHEDQIGVVRPSTLTPAISFTDTADSYGRERGRVLHLLLQYLPALAPEARTKAGERFLTARAKSWPKAERDKALSQVITVLDEPRFAAAFAPGSRAEAPIAGKVAALGADAFISGQIDRLAVTDGTVLVVDYKTNRHVPSRPETAPKAYLNQMALYREAMRAAFPGRTVRCALLWTEAPSLMELPDSLLDSALQQLRRA